MAIIGVLKPTKCGGWEGAIETLTFKRRVEFVPNDNRASDSAPHFRVFAGRSELGKAWSQHGAANGRAYLKVKLDDPCLPEFISAALFESEDGREAQLVWNRGKIG